MKKLLLTTAFMIWPVFAVAQTNLYFPRNFTEQDRQSTGFAIVNPGAGPATAFFTLYGTDGVIVASVQRTIPARGQFAQLGSELFPGSAASGWVEVSSAVSGLQGFWLGGEFVNLTRGDGAVSAPLATDQVFPYVQPTSSLGIANPSTMPISVTITAYNELGSEIGNNTRTIAPKGISQLTLSSIFQTAALAYIRISSPALFASCVVMSATSVLDNAVQNGIDVSAASPDATTLVFPHFIEGLSGNLNYSSIVAVVNLSASRNVTVRVQFSYGTGGSSMESQPVVLTPRSAVSGRGIDFVEYTQVGFQNGYLRVVADGPIAGVVSYGTSGDGGEAIVPAQVMPQTSVLFAHIADLIPWSTGIAFQNPSSVAADIEVFAMNPDGTLIGGGANVATARFTLAGGGKMAKLLSELIPQTQTRSSDGGFVFVRVTNGVPIHAIQLFFTRNLKILANISGGALPPGMTFTPPNP